MRNIIGGDHEIDQTHWTLSIVRRNGLEEKKLVATGHHSFLVIEGADVNGQRVAIEAHLGYRDIGNDQHDDTKAQIYYFPSQLSKLQLLSSDKYVKKTWAISLDEKNQIENRILHDKQFTENNEVPYVYVGKTNTSGFLGASLEASGSTTVKNASLQINQSLKASHNPSANASYDIVDAVLRRGHNCTSWAKDMAPLQK